MFRTKYTLAELARMLRRSEQSLRRDVRMGRLPTGSSRRRRSMGGGTRYEFAHQDLERNLAPRDMNRLNVYLGKKHVKTEEQIASRGIKRCVTCEMFRSVSKFPPEADAPDKLNKECVTCLETKALHKVTLKKEKPEDRYIAPKKTDWSGFFRRDKK